MTTEAPVHRACAGTLTCAAAKPTSRAAIVCCTPTTPEGRARTAEAQRRRWAAHCASGLSQGGGIAVPLPQPLGNPMTAVQYRNALAQLGLTPTAAARLLGIDERTSRRYSSRGISGAPEILLKLLLIRRISASDVNDAIRYRSI